jgi:nicotinate-nucleotide pyrophosphorylase (carboxylating)
MNPAIEKYIKNALDEDIAQIGDLTSLATISKDAVGEASFIVKEPCIIAGVELVKSIAYIVDADLKVDFSVKDGDEVVNHHVIGSIHGSVQSILLAERLMLNCMQRMSGIATKVAGLKKMIQAYPAKILDTRKTTPNNRIIEKWAVRIGGGYNHRFGLYDMILIKDNHIKAAGSVTEALQKTKLFLIEQNSSIPVVVEVKNEIELKEAVAFDLVDRILLDNMSPVQVTKMIQITATKKPLEVSGGVNKDNILAYAATGVDYISVGDLTHHIQSIDISLKII